eukprot:TRINITY_DN4299_c0_g1_i1.p1 TRINITY_DN4299_c0_g1~~TRINITY_DN4299_c0_g1_i1.p1  ORF type:complete len:433 (-),score=52.65 TRINITY_DN4299_c0_g1_i1:94-1392(-)
MRKHLPLLALVLVLVVAVDVETENLAFDYLVTNSYAWRSGSEVLSVTATDVLLDALHFYSIQSHIQFGTLSPEKASLLRQQVVREITAEMLSFKALTDEGRSEYLKKLEVLSQSRSSHQELDQVSLDASLKIKKLDQDMISARDFVLDSALSGFERAKASLSFQLLRYDLLDVFITTLNQLLTYLLQVQSSLDSGLLLKLLPLFVESGGDFENQDVQAVFQELQKVYFGRPYFFLAREELVTFPQIIQQVRIATQEQISILSTNLVESTSSSLEEVRTQWNSTALTVERRLRSQIPGFIEQATQATVELLLADTITARVEIVFSDVPTELEIGVVPQLLKALFQAESGLQEESISVGPLQASSSSSDLRRQDSTLSVLSTTVTFTEVPAPPSPASSIPVSGNPSQMASSSANSPLSSLSFAVAISLAVGLIV